MKFKGVRITIAAGEGAFAKASDESVVRKHYAQALNQARKKKEASAVVRAAAEGDFSPVASAKILAQEIYRVLRGRPRRGSGSGCRLREIRCVVSSGKIQSVFQKTIAGYLKHLEEVLSQGPFVTVDMVIETGGGVVLIERRHPPFGWALPGGFVDYGETLEQAALREANEETGLCVKKIKLLGVYSSPGRDPRFHTVTAVFVGQAKGRPRAASDAASARVAVPSEWRAMKLAFDHRKILQDYLRAKRRSRC